ncbi:putative beta-adaptin [Leptomonas pyrrhocoris]|uniref:Putative beta-adaptin n=1 Tax=Leptomonas pyrrhocoris TaxID=157538 RepID=A0A0M9G3I1_LEPPY|nr:putative beta-adaptin [Leptomonas pyrrhocoris]XP_015660110.1 putative beta-adaptin [Leptomonas pyrrhocoris]KPA81670.1 putative beta-adaptin [Leptomonas pyrrhocoris]KPA81671.1 putative beta-adaptin [Leptomonas pyrrhocoris]|eukprot:XP_015660109.1 putative beta-adaptin [Leptomonas pyrrhocoris]
MSQSPATKKGGEIDDIRACLREPPKPGDAPTKRAALRKVVAMMTSGIDTSALFPDVIMSCFTSDVVCKKLIYLYLITQSKGKEDLAVLAINALVKECSDQSPVVRGVALRTLAAMHVPNLLEYLVPLVEKGLSDSSAYVRKTAVCCLLRQYHRSVEDFYEHQYFEHALRMLSDPDVQVSSNALDVLLEVTRLESIKELAAELHPPFIVSKSLLYQLLNRLRVLNEWQQIQVIRLCLQYTPSSEDEMFDMMNLLDERLESNNTGVVIACSCAFFHLTQNAPAVQRKVFQRLREPLLVIATSHVTETAYAALCHVKLLVQRDPRLFDEDIRAFYCTVNEPSSNKCVKMDILASTVTAASVKAVLDELVAYSEDRNATVARTAIATMGRVTLRLPDALGSVLALFTDFITLGLEDVRGATLSVLADVLRQHVQLDKVRPLLQTIVQCYKASPFTDDESRLSFLWLLGEFGEYVAEAPYILEIFSDSVLKEPAALRLQLLTSAATLFFKRPPEMQRCLGRVFHALLNEFTSADVLDKALLYFRLLRTDVAVAARVICAAKAPIRAFAEDVDANLLDRLMAEFDTLSVVYGVPQETFIVDDKASAGDEEEEEEQEVEEERREGKQLEMYNPNDVDGNGANTRALFIGDASAAGMDQLFGSDDAARAAPLCLSSDAQLDASVFQQQWSQLDVAATFSVTLQTSGMPSVDAVEAALEDHDIFVLASGVQDGAQKLFLYAEATAPTRCWFFIEAFVTLTGAVRVTVKADAPSSSPTVVAFEALLRCAFDAVE